MGSLEGISMTTRFVDNLDTSAENKSPTGFAQLFKLINIKLDTEKYNKKWFPFPPSLKSRVAEILKSEKD